MTQAAAITAAAMLGWLVAILLAAPRLEHEAEALLAATVVL